MNASISVTDLNKSFALAEYGGGPVSLFEALRLGKKELVQRHVDALKDISFNIRSGERVGIIGRNGAGKTTLLSLLAGISEPTSGNIEVEGDLHAMLSIGAVLREEATGRENIYLDGAIHKRTRAEIDQVANEIIAFSELGEFIERPVRTYSSGMKARLAFSMGAFIKTDILVIDETLSVGDATFSRKATRRMKEMTSAGQIVIVVSHSLSSIVEICNRCFWLDNGKLVMDGTPEEVTKAYLRDVEKADADELLRKFGTIRTSQTHAGKGTLKNLQLFQDGKPISASAKAFVPLDIKFSGELHEVGEEASIQLNILRVDGKKILKESIPYDKVEVPRGKIFNLSIRLDPFVLGENLYRIDILLMSGKNTIDNISQVFQVSDEEGQFGGSPTLYYPIEINSDTRERH